MNESIRQGLIMTVAGILFCIAVTMLMLELKAEKEFESLLDRCRRWDERVRQDALAAADEREHAVVYYIEKLGV